MLGGYLGVCEMEVMIYHFKGAMPQDLFQAVDVTPIKQIISSKRVPTKVSVQPLHTGNFGKL